MFTRVTTLIQFPVYLLPSIPFRRQKVVADSAISLASSPLTGDPGSPTTDDYLQGHASHLRCAKCAVDVCLTSQIISKGFTGRHGRAYLVSPSPPPRLPRLPEDRNGFGLPNTKTDTPSQRQLVTGIHTVCDVRCYFCGSMLGWKYDGAEEESQRYKVGKYILETKMVCSSSDWEHGHLGILPSSLQSRSEATEQINNVSDIEFDSQDEDECEDLFAGVWSPYLAVKRRQARNFRKAVTDIDSKGG